MASHDMKIYFVSGRPNSSMLPRQCPSEIFRYRITWKISDVGYRRIKQMLSSVSHPRMP